jgi:hypothetical protein
MARKPNKTKFQLVMLNRQHNILKELSERAKRAPGSLAGDLAESFKNQLQEIKAGHGMQFIHGHDSAIIQMLLMKNAGMISGEQFETFIEGIRSKT